MQLIKGDFAKKSPFIVICSAWTLSNGCKFSLNSVAAVLILYIFDVLFYRSVSGNAKGIYQNLQYGW